MQMLQSDEKSVTFVKELVQKFSNPGNLVLDPISGELKSQNRISPCRKGGYVRDEKGIGRLKRSMAGRADDYDCRLLNDTSD